MGWNCVSRPDPVTKWRDLVCGGFLDTNCYVALPGLWVDLWDKEVLLRLSRHCGESSTTEWSDLR